MHNKTGVATLIASAAMAAAAAAHAEQVVYVTPTAYGVVDSSSPGVDVTPGGPIAYSLPAGFAIVGVDTDTEVGSIRMLARSGTACQLYTEGQNGTPGLSTTGASFSCPAATGDIDFGDNSDNSNVYNYGAAAGDQVLFVVQPNGAATFTTQLLPVTGLNGATADVTGIALPPPDLNGNYGVDAKAGAIVKLVPTQADQASPLTEESPISLGFTPSGPTSLDQSDASDLLYLFTGGKLYSVNTGSSAVTPLGSLPAGTIAAALVQDGVGDSRATVAGPTGNVVIASSAGKVNAAAAPTPGFAPSGYSYPLGFFTYNITDLTPGESVTVTITVPQGTNVSSLMKCSDTSCAPFTASIDGGNVYTLSLTDGGKGDNDGAANGVIDDPFAPALAAGAGSGSSGGGSSSSGSGSGSSGGSSDGSGGGAIAPVLLLPLGGLALLRRRKPRNR